MAGQRVVEQRVLLARAAADIVEDERHAGGILAVGHDAGVRHPPADHLGEDIARPPIGGIVGDRERRPLPPPIGGEIGNAAVIDVAIGASEAPVFRVGPKIGLHVGVYKGLQVDAERIAERADHDVGADALGAVDVAVGKAQHAVGGVIGQRDPDLPPRRTHHPLRMGERHRFARHAECEHRAEKGAPCRLEG